MLRTAHFSALVVVVVASVFVAADDARACSCDGGGSMRLASSATTAVPINAAAFAVFEFRPSDPVELAATADGVDVALAPAELVDGLDVFVIRPQAGAWPPNAAIEIGGNITSSLSFTTSSTTEPPRTTAPDDLVVGDVIAFRTTLPEGCGDGRHFRASIESAVPFLVRSTDDDDVAAPRPTGLGGSVGLGGACSGSSDWQDADFNASKRFRFASFAVDGTLTPFSPAVDVAFPDDSDCDGISDVNDDCPDEAGAVDPDFAAGTFGGCPDDGAADANVGCPDGSKPLGCGGCASTSMAPTALATLLMLLVRRRRSR